MGKNLKKRNYIGIYIPLLFFLGWLVIPIIFNTPEYILPSLPSVIKGMVDFIFGNFELSTYSGQFFKNAHASTIRVLIGFAIAVCFGVPMGLLTGYISTAKKLADPFVHMIRMIPGIGWLPIAMVWFGVGNKTTIFLIALAAFFPVYVNTAKAVEEIPQILLDAGKMLGANLFSLFTTIIIPASVPGIFAGLRLSLGICWSFLVLGELTGVSVGLGAVMMDSRMLGNIQMIIISMILIAILGRISDLILLAIYRYIRPKVMEL